MKKFALKVERWLVKLVLSPELRPLEAQAARAVLLKVLVRAGLPAAVVAVIIDEIIKTYFT